MSLASEVRTWSGFLGGLRDFLRNTIDLEDAKQIIQQRLEKRETNFLDRLEHGVYGYPQSPYLPMLKLAGCELGDLRAMVADRGLEATLRTLRDAGVYVTYEEFKGRRQIVRAGQVIPVSVADFDNPHAHHHYHGESGGTTGSPTRVLIDLEHLAAQAPVLMLGWHANGVLDVPTAVWLDILPDVAGIMNILRPIRFGRIPEKWFSPNMIRHSSPVTSAKFRLATLSMVPLARLQGIRMPWPELVGLDDPDRIAHWMADTLRKRDACMLYSHVSKALRVAIAAREAGLDLTGATFMAGGEPPTPAKVKEITASGAAWVPIYPFSEYGTVGVGCANPRDENDVHLLDDGLALIQHPRPIPGTTVTVDAFNFTTLLPHAPKLLLNVESDDYGLIEERPCGCELETVGFPRHVRDIRSFSKLTGEAGTLIGSAMVRILEEVLPARFGGSSLDYQLMEEEDDQGFTRLSVLVHPRVQIEDETEVIETILAALEPEDPEPGTGSFAAEMTRNVWRQAETLRVRRIPPKVTGHGKMMPLHVSRNRPDA